MLKTLVLRGLQSSRLLREITGLGLGEAKTITTAPAPVRKKFLRTKLKLQKLWKTLAPVELS